jgi:hypothetical protein
MLPEGLHFHPGSEEFPWLTGTLLAPSAYVTPKGYINIEPMLFAAQSTAVYNQHWHAQKAPKLLVVNPLLVLQVGLTDEIDFQIIPQAFHYQKQDASSTNFGDLPAGFDFQILSEEKGKWWPAIKFSIIEIFPTGKYQKLNPKKNFTDATGAGSYTTVPSLVFSKLFRISKQLMLNAYLTFEYFIPSKVHVQGFNAYGGGFGTRGKVRPGTILTTILSGELSLTRNWVLALDIQHTNGNKASFSGKRGTNTDGTIAKVGYRSYDQISLAPAIEYNFDSSFGIIAGAWFSVAGRNANQFAGGAIGFNWYLNTKKSR